MSEEIIGIIIFFLILLICFGFPSIFSKLIEFLFGKTLIIDEHEKEIKKEIKENEGKIRKLEMRLSVLYAMQKLCRKI